MEDFLGRFSENGTEFTAVREGTITGLLSIGTLLGAIIAAPIADKFGRRMCILVGNILFWIGMIVQMTSTTAWYQVAIGRLIAGFGVGKLSVLTPMYMSVSFKTSLGINDVLMVSQRKPHPSKFVDPWFHVTNSSSPSVSYLQT